MCVCVCARACVYVHANMTRTDKKMFFVIVMFHKPLCVKKTIKIFPMEYAASSKTEVKTNGHTG